MAEKNLFINLMRTKKKIALFGMGGLYWIGGVQYITNIIHALNAWTEGPEFEIHLIKNADQHFVELTDLKNVTIVFHNLNEFFPPWSFTNRVQWFLERKLLKRLVPRMENHFLKEKFDFVFPVPLSGRKGQLNSAAWIADFQYHHYPKGASKEATDAAFGEISFIANHAHKIVLSSKACETDCNTIFPVTSGRTYAMPFTVFINEKIFENNCFDAVIQKYRVPKDFLMVSNSFCPTKNHKTLFRALGILRKQGLVINLLCTGNIVDWRNLHFANESLLDISENQIRDQVHLLGIIPRQDQLLLYRMSKAIVQPSVNEGWSTSVEEAKALGKNLIVSDIDVHKEQCPDKRFMFSATNAEDLASKIKLLWEQEGHKVFPESAAERLAFDNYKKSVIRFAERFNEIMEAKNN